MATDLDVLQGTWHLSTFEVDGQAAAPGGATIVITGKTFVSIGMGATYEGTVTINQTKTPKTIDLVFTVGHAAGTRNPGIYKLSAGKLTMCLATHGDVRPKAFTTKPESGHVLEVFTRSPVPEASRKRSVTRAAGAKQPSEAPVVEGSGAPTVWEGEWAMVGGVFGGAPMTDGMIQWARRVTRGDVTSVIAGPQVILKAQFALDPSKTPAAVDYVNLTGAQKGKAQAGIFVLTGDALEVCMAPPGKPRPRKFASVRGDGLSYTTWRRERP